MILNDYMTKYFPNLELRPPLFYSWNISIRFELGVEHDSDDAYENIPYIQGVYQRAIALFNSLHSINDEIYLVVDVNDHTNGIKSKPKIFNRYIKNKSLLYRLKQKTIPYVFPEDDEEGIYTTNRFTLKCKKSDLNYITLLKAICNQDMGIKPSVFHRVYFINSNRKTIFHVYDDRGCDLLATSPETIRKIYEKYNDWILDYDRSEIDKIFK